MLQVPLHLRTRCKTHFLPFSTHRCRHHRLIPPILPPPHPIRPRPSTKYFISFTFYLYLKSIQYQNFTLLLVFNGVAIFEKYYYHRFLERNYYRPPKLFNAATGYCSF